MSDIYDDMIVLDNLKKIVALEKSKEDMIIAYDSLDSKSEYMLETGEAGINSHETNDPVIEDVETIEAAMEDIDSYIKKIDSKINELKAENIKLSGLSHDELMSGLSEQSRDYVLGREETRKSTL